ncbi:MAG TPA: extracellular solute-binding protein, partial [Gaiellaceae bacterium]
MSRRQVLKGLGVSAAAGAVGGPRLAVAQAKPVTLTYVNYSAGVDKPMWDSLIGEFAKANPGITIRYQPVPGESWGDYFDKLATMIAGGNPPDVSRVAIEGARLVVSRGLATPLDDFMKGDAEIEEYMKDVSPRLLEVFRVDGKTYELPFDWNNMVMYYNTKMLEKEKLAAPKKEWTKDEFVTLADRLTKRSASGEPEVFGFGFAVQYFSGTMPWMFANATNILSDDWTKSNLQDPKVLEVLQFMQDLVWKHKVSPKPPASHTDIYSLMAAGKIAMAGGGRWPVLQMTKAG